MNKIEFSKLSTKEDMILAFNQLKDDYRQLFAINEEQQEENERLSKEVTKYDEILCERNNEVDRLNKECNTYMKIATKRGNIINELEKWFKSYHKYQNRLKWNEQDYIDFIDNLEKELKEGEKDEI